VLDAKYKLPTSNGDSWSGRSRGGIAGPRFRSIRLGQAASQTLAASHMGCVESNMIRAESLIENVRKWAERRDDIRALVLVGSHARGEARPDSDVDLVLICADPSHYLDTTDWLSTFGAVMRFAREDWGKVQSVRVFYQDGSEVEFGITGTDWAAVPVDSGTAAVLRNGASVLLDRDGQVDAALRSVGGSASERETPVNER